MAGSLSYTAILDACVLYPSALRDILIRLAIDEVYRARWTSEIHDEWVRSLLEKRSDLTAERLNRTVQLMNEAVDDCLVEDYSYLTDTLTLPDPDDRHVLAAAIVGHADAIVTYNLKDFPEDVVSRHKIEILHPDDFLVAQYDLNPLKIIENVKESRAELKKNKRTPEEQLETYRALSLPLFAAKIETALALI